MICDLIPLATDNSLILTANQRLSLQIQREHEQLQITQKQQVWDTLQVMPLYTWLNLMWSTQIANTERLLNNQQELRLWQNIIEQSPHGKSLIQTQTCAQLAKQAWQLLHAAQLPLSILTTDANEQTELFYHFAQSLQSICEQRRFITTAEITQQLINHCNKLKLPDKIILCGFDELPPITVTLWNSLKERCEIVHFYAKTINQKINQIALPDTQAEINTMVSWAHNLYTQDAKTKIACIVPNLSALRTQINTAFSETFQFEKIIPGYVDDQLIYNISAAPTLNEFAIVQTALQALTLATNKIDTQTTRLWLQSPYLCHNASDLNFGAQCDALLREQNILYSDFKATLPILTKLYSLYPQTTWLKRWRIAIQQQVSETEKHSIKYWAGYFANWLGNIGWPGARSLNSIEYQLHARFEQCLFELTALELTANLMSFNEALMQFTSLVNETPFQAEGSDAPIQILGILESAGMQFDHCWLMGLHSEAWPGTANPNPFIPHSIQVKYNMPHASATRELNYAKQSLLRIQQSANQIIISYPILEGDRVLQPSPLINRNIMVTTNNWQNQTPDYISCMQTQNQLETLIDEQGPPVVIGSKVQGGSYILKEQANCPFKAFAHARLKAISLTQPSLGLTAAARGTIVHLALEQIWGKLKSQQTLLKTSKLALEQLIDEAAIAATKQYQQQAPQQVNWLKLESKRIAMILKEWLALEKQRAPFKVFAQETERHIEIENIKFNLKIDRIDQLANGDYIIIDYKTGKTSIKNWFGERLTEPQLPLYCTFGTKQDMNYKAAIFAEVKSGNMQFKGICDEALDTQIATDVIAANKISPLSTVQSWQTLLQTWSTNLNKITLEFSQGAAAVAPSNDACSFCDLQPLCRIKE